MLRQGGNETFADIQVELLFLVRGSESVENKTYEVAAATTNPAGSPHVRLATKGETDRIPKSESFINKYALKLTFGAKDADGNIPGTIYLCTPDSGKSFLAGKFTATVK